MWRSVGEIGSQNLFAQQVLLRGKEKTVGFPIEDGEKGFVNQEVSANAREGEVGRKPGEQNDIGGDREN